MQRESELKEMPLIELNALMSNKSEKYIYGNYQEIQKDIDLIQKVIKSKMPKVKDNSDIPVLPYP
ncbi:MAG: hypothetical protein EOP48_30780, partial [Sphingobacteriales bacterium]